MASPYSDGFSAATNGVFFHKAIQSKARFYFKSYHVKKVEGTSGQPHRILNLARFAPAIDLPRSGFRHCGCLSLNENRATKCLRTFCAVLCRGSARPLGRPIHYLPKICSSGHNIFYLVQNIDLIENYKRSAKFSEFLKLIASQSHSKAEFSSIRFICREL